MSSALAFSLAFVSGYIALSYEILWYRVYSIAMTSRAQAFGLLLGGYLLGVASGSFAARAVCTERADRRLGMYTLTIGVACANVLGYLFVPIFGWLMTTSRGWGPATLLLAVTAAGLGVVFPIVVHLGRRHGAVGSRVSFIYVANILGSAAGTLLTGLILMDRLSLPAMTTIVGLLGLACAGALLVSSESRRPVMGGALAILTLLAAGMVELRSRLFFDLYEKLTFRSAYRPDVHFTHVVENRTSVVTVTTDGTVYGGGLYDGVFNTDLRSDGRNAISRAYAIGALHPAPKDVLLIGLGSGAWAEVIANHALVERVTVVEINPGYLQLLPLYPAVSGLIANPKVRIEIDDGRRWLQRHPAATFDLIVGNTTYDWRSNATSLLSVGFLEIVGRHLKDGGVYYYNTTSEGRVQKTGAVVFPSAWRVNNMLAVGNAAFTPDLDRLRRQLTDYRLNGRPVLDPGQSADRSLLDEIVEVVRAGLEPRDEILRRTAALELVTDDNMGTEWRRLHSFWGY